MPKTKIQNERGLLALADALVSDDPSAVAVALGDIARAHGMSEIARKTGLQRESLYKALSANGNPSLATILKVAGAVGIKLKVRSFAEA